MNFILIRKSASDGRRGEDKEEEEEIKEEGDGQFLTTQLLLIASFKLIKLLIGENTLFGQRPRRG